MSALSSAIGTKTKAQIKSFYQEHKKNSRIGNLADNDDKREKNNEESPKESNIEAQVPIHDETRGNNVRSEHRLVHTHSTERNNATKDNLASGDLVYNPIHSGQNTASFHQPSDQWSHNMALVIEHHRQQQINEHQLAQHQLEQQRQIEQLAQLHHLNQRQHPQPYQTLMNHHNEVQHSNLSNMNMSSWIQQALHHEARNQPLRFMDGEMFV